MAHKRVTHSPLATDLTRTFLSSEALASRSSATRCRHVIKSLWPTSCLIMRLSSLILSIAKRGSSFRASRLRICRRRAETWNAIEPSATCLNTRQWSHSKAGSSRCRRPSEHFGVEHAQILHQYHVSSHQTPRSCCVA